MKIIKEIIKSLTPPIFQKIRTMILKKDNLTAFYGVYGDFSEVAKLISVGYDSDISANHLAQKTMNYIERINIFDSYERKFKLLLLINTIAKDRTAVIKRWPEFYSNLVQ